MQEREKTEAERKEYWREKRWKMCFSAATMCNIKFYFLEEGEGKKESEGGGNLLV